MKYVRADTQGVQLLEIWKPLPKTNRGVPVPFDGDPYLLRVGGFAWQGRLQGDYWDLAEGLRLPHRGSRYLPDITGWLSLSLLNTFRHLNGAPPTSNPVVVQVANGGYWRSGYWSAARGLWEMPHRQLDRSAPARRTLLKPGQVSAWVDLEEITATLWRKSLMDTEVAW